MNLELLTDGTINNSYHSGAGTEQDPYFWSTYSSNINFFPLSISLKSNKNGILYIKYSQLNTNLYSGLPDESKCLPYLGPYDKDTSTSSKVLANGTTAYTAHLSSASIRYFFFDITECVGITFASIDNLFIWFKESDVVTSTTPEPNISTDSPLFIHVGDINISDDACGRYKLTLDGNDANYFSIYGKRIYLTKYPPLAKTYTVNVCAKDLANRFTPVCDTFSIDITKCEFTTEPPTTTPAPNYGFVPQENNISTVTEYTYNKIYSMKHIK